MQVLDDLWIRIAQWLRGVFDSFLPPWAAQLVMDVLGILLLIVWGIVVVLAFTYMERKVIARVGDRIGPNRAGPFGIFQAIADAIKMLTKEDVTPTNADRAMFLAAPIVIVIPAVLLYAVLPFGRGMVGVDLSIAVVFVVAMGGIPILTMLMAGWASNNKYALLGGFRTVAQLISYEVPMVVALLTVVLLAGTMSTVGIVEAQARFPFALVTPVAFVVYMLAGLAELNRTPFDLLEADSEIVAGYFIEYSGMKFAMFFLAEYINLFMVAGMITTLFLAGWQWPILPSWLWFLIKVIVVIFLMMWIRSTIPRFRIDQMLGFAWKALVPLSLVNLFVVALVAKVLEPGWARTGVLFVSNLALLAGAGAILSRQSRKREEQARVAGEAAIRRYYGSPIR
ncbi:MAG: NADH-quinone oxidoreductase subunit NuoH [Chloroflexi bacterium]|nr:NADH-quinone oxidoreductase subunit NuoH [Chloroflexota bacterium]